VLIEQYSDDLREWFRDWKSYSMKTDSEN